MSFLNLFKKKPKHPVKPWPFPTHPYNQADFYFVENIDNPEQIHCFTANDITQVSFPTPDRCLIITKSDQVIRGLNTECYINTSTECWNYVIRTAKGLTYSDQDKWKWIKEEGISKYLLYTLNELGIPLDIQEYICQHHPNLISQIENLDPTLKTKYEHELNLSTVDV